ncbi:hypothetical protein ATE84_2318 [Aquimarina sp. MAR_2010_214]|uniref:hypothetical protein n=1 Tax=Aquimarina sp. MAR_2010_214 TaxID=1250026 RepID=UPI000C7036E8|nr:hypothetical protein [Aquimarina sp. MAR_2010_214]PKV50263.1 hypothetical protein ATE84_2318 [Aquimarina sp. MAR_2010_214]
MKLIKKIFICTAIAGSAIFTGCEKKNSDEVSPETSIFQDYLVRYNITKKETVAKATFRRIDKKGVRLELKGKSSVKFNGTKYDRFNTADNYFYRWGNKKGLLDVKITYAKDEKKVFNNTFKLTDAPKIDFKSGHENLDLKKDNLITWKGEPLKPGEMISALVYQGDESSGTNNAFEVGATSLVISKDALKGLKAGKASIHLRRELVKNNLKEEDGKAGGKVTFETIVFKETVIK